MFASQKNSERIKSEITLDHEIKIHSAQIHWHAENSSSSSDWYLSPVDDGRRP